MSETDPQPATPKPKRYWYQYSLRTLLVATALLALLLGLAVQFRSHLLVRFMMARSGLSEVEAIPVNPMPETPVPKGWVQCRLGSLHFALPPEMAGNVVIPENGAPVRAFHDGSKSVIVWPPERTGEMEHFMETDLKLPPQGQGMSRPRLRSACCQASSTDFRWTMTQEEVRWHAWCIAVSPFLRLESDGWAETTFRADLDGIVLFSRNRRRAAFDWQVRNKPIGAFIHFKDKSRDLDPSWVRSVCQSVRFCEETQATQQPSGEKKPACPGPAK